MTGHTILENALHITSSPSAADAIESLGARHLLVPQGEGAWLPPRNAPELKQNGFLCQYGRLPAADRDEEWLRAALQACRLRGSQVWLWTEAGSAGAVFRAWACHGLLSSGIGLDALRERRFAPRRVPTDLIGCCRPEALLRDCPISQLLEPELQESAALWQAWTAGDLERIHTWAQGPRLDERGSPAMLDLLKWRLPRAVDQLSRWDEACIRTVAEREARRGRPSALAATPAHVLSDNQHLSWDRASEAWLTWRILRLSNAECPHAPLRLQDRPLLRNAICSESLGKPMRDDVWLTDTGRELLAGRTLPRPPLWQTDTIGQCTLPFANGEGLFIEGEELRGKPMNP